MTHCAASQDEDLDAPHEDVQWCLTEAGLDDRALTAMEQQDDADISRLQTLLNQRHRSKRDIAAMRGSLQRVVPKFTQQQGARNWRVQQRMSALQTRLRAAHVSGAAIEAALSTELAAHQETRARVAELEAECQRLWYHATGGGSAAAGALSLEASLQVLISCSTCTAASPAVCFSWPNWDNGYTSPIRDHTRSGP